jgi:hypothetical protein
MNSRACPSTPSDEGPILEYKLDSCSTYQAVKDWIEKKGMGVLNVNLYQDYPVKIHWGSNTSIFIWNHSTYSWVEDPFNNV